MRSYRLSFVIGIIFLLLLNACEYNNPAGSLETNLENSLEGLDIRLNCNAGNTFENLNNFGLVAHDNENLYIAFLDKGLYKYNLVQHTMSKLLDEKVCSLNVLDGWIYYLKLLKTDGIYKVRTDGTDYQKISDIEASFLYIQGDTIYAQGVFEKFNCNIFTMNLEGNDVEILCDKKVDLFYLYDGYIFYTESIPWDGTDPIVDFRLNRMRLDGSEKRVIIEGCGGIEWFTIYDDNIFLVYLGNLYKMGFSEQELKMGHLGQTKQKVIDMGNVFRPTTYNVYKNKILYSTLDSLKLMLHNFDMETEEMSEEYVPFQNKQGTIISICDYVIGNKIFRIDCGKFFVMELDGSNVRAFPQ